MLSITNVKIKTLFVLILLFLLILLPFSIYFYNVNDAIDTTSMFRHISSGICLSFGFALILNEYIYKKVFFTMLKGKLIRNSNSKYKIIMLLFYFLFFLEFVLWISFFISKYNFYIGLNFIYLLLIITVNRDTYIISNGYLLINTRIIAIDSIQWYSKTERKSWGALTIRYQSNRSITTSGDSHCINELTNYFKLHKIYQKFTN